MADLLIQDIDSELYLLLEWRARINGRTLEEEVEWLMRKGLALPDSRDQDGNVDV
jgi:plasmid stability protein